MSVVVEVSATLHGSHQFQFCEMSDSTYTYYTEEYALALKPIVDAMILDKRPRNFSCRKYHKTVGSLEKMISRSLNYLVDKLDPDSRYYKFRRAVKVSKIKNSEVGDSVLLIYKVPMFGVERPAILIDEVTAEEATHHSESKSEFRETTLVVVTKKNKEPEKPPTPLFDLQEAVDRFLESSEPELILTNLVLTEETKLALLHSLASMSFYIEVVEMTDNGFTLKKKQT